MSNPYDEWENHKFFSGAVANKNGSYSTTAVTILLSSAGWYRVTGDQDFVVTGPFSTVVPAAVSTAAWYWADETPVVKSLAGQSLSIIRGGGASGTYHVNKIKGP